MTAGVFIVYNTRKQRGDRHLWTRTPGNEESLQT
jgi:hypothetical protein